MTMKRGRVEGASINYVIHANFADSERAYTYSVRDSAKILTGHDFVFMKRIRNEGIVAEYLTVSLAIFLKNDSS